MGGNAKGWLDSESGATAVEYALMLALISVAIVTAVTALGTNINVKFAAVATVFCLQTDGG